MNAKIALALAAAAFPSSSSAFRPSHISARPPTTSLRSLRDIASYSDESRMMSEFEAFDRNGAFSRSPRGGMYGRHDGLGGSAAGGGPMNQYERRGAGMDRMYTRDGFDPYSAYGNSFGVSQSDRRGRGGMMGYGRGYGPDQDMMMMGGPNGVRNDNTMGGFSYSSRVREYGGRGGGPFMYDYGMDMGFEGPPMDSPMDYDQGGYGGGYGGFDGDMSRLGP